MSDKVEIDIAAIGAKPAPMRQASSGGGGSRGPKKVSGGFTFYKLHSLADTEESGKAASGNPNYRITKFNEDLNVESSYNMDYFPSSNGGYYDCKCPASKFDCRHKGIMKHIVEAKKVDAPEFFCFETRTFKLAEDIQ